MTEEPSIEETELIGLIAEVRARKAVSVKTAWNLKESKEQLRIFMVDSGIKEYDGVEIRRSIVFDLELLRLEHSDLFEKYCEREEKTVFKNSWRNKKMKDLFMRDNPTLSRDADYRSEKTPAVYGL